MCRSWLATSGRKCIVIHTGTELNMGRPRCDDANSSRRTLAAASLIRRCPGSRTSTNRRGKCSLSAHGTRAHRLGGAVRDARRASTSVFGQTESHAPFILVEGTHLVFGPDQPFQLAHRRSRLVARKAGREPQGHVHKTAERLDAKRVRSWQVAARPGSRVARWARGPTSDRRLA